MAEKQALHDSPSLSAVSIKAPEFTESSASGWFCILEAQFALGRVVNSSTKFFHALSSLPASIITRMSPETLQNQDYDELKAHVLAQVEASKPELFEQLVKSYTLTGRPSAYLAQLEQTAKKVGIGDEFVRYKFLQALPNNVSPVLAAQSALSLQQIGSLADELVTMVGSSNSQNIQAINYDRSRSHQEQHHSKYVDRNLTPFRENQQSKICRAHIFFGAEARSCRKWCQWPDKSRCHVEQNSRPNSRNNSPARPPTPALRRPRGN